MPETLKTMIGYVRRFDPSYLDAFAKIQAGAIGPVNRVTAAANFNADRRSVIDAWWSRPAVPMRV